VSGTHDRPATAGAPGVPGVPRYETSDVPVRTLVVAFGGLGVALAALLVLVAWVLSLLGGKPDAGPWPEAPEPRLATDLPAALARLRAWEDARLGSYGWADRDAERFHVPVEHAARLVAGERR
jgi:hypothetical protein